MKLKSVLEKVSISPSLRNKIAAVFTLFASASCAAPVKNVAEPVPDPPEAASLEEDPTAPVTAELVAALGGEGEGFQPDGRSFVLCKHIQGVTDTNIVLLSIGKEAMQQLCDRLGIPLKPEYLEKAKAHGASLDDMHCVIVTLPAE